MFRHPPLADGWIESPHLHLDLGELPLESGEVLRDAFGKVPGGDYLDYYVGCKRRDWRQAHEQITEWERDRYLQLF